MAAGLVGDYVTGVQVAPAEEDGSVKKRIELMGRLTDHAIDDILSGDARQGLTEARLARGDGGTAAGEPKNPEPPWPDCKPGDPCVPMAASQAAAGRLEAAGRPEAAGKASVQLEAEVRALQPALAWSPSTVALVWSMAGASVALLAVMAKAATERMIKRRLCPCGAEAAQSDDDAAGEYTAYEGSS